MLTRILCGAAICLAFGASVLRAEGVGDAAEGLTPGNWYQVKYDRDGVEEDGFGELVSADEHWVTLSFIVRGRSEQGVPILSKTPYVNRFFKNVGISDSHVTVFVPRDAVTEISPQEAPSAETDRRQASEFPRPGENVTVCYSEGGERQRKRGQLVSVDDQKVVLTCTEVVGQTSSVPVLSQIPLVGGMFTKQVFTRREVNTHIAADKVLCLSVTDAFFERATETMASLK